MTEDAENADVVVIDDSELARDLMVDLLEECGLRVAALSTAVGAVSLIAQSSIAVVVSDINMPELPGNSLVKLLRENPRCDHVKVVFVSGLERDELHALCTQAEADGIVEKARLDTDLVPIVRQLLRTARPH